MAMAESTKVRALREAKGLLQSFGFNGFSFQHIADLVGIKKPSLYDHFESKEELGKVLIQDYHHNFTRWTEDCEALEPAAKVAALFELFLKFSKSSGKICPLSALIADYHSLPKSLKKPLTKMFLFQRQWLKNVIEEGQKKKVFRKDRDAKDLAELVMSIGLGSQLMARLTEKPEDIQRLKTQALLAITLK